MRSLMALSIAALATGASAGVVSHTFNFDDLTPGANANDTFQPSGLGVSFFYGVFSPDEDEFGDPIPGSERWRIDTEAPDVIVDNPATYGRGPAPSGLLALEALFQPVLITFDNPTGVLNFSATLDNDTFGFNGFLPGLEDISLQFYRNDGSLIQRFAIDQTTPGFMVEASGLSDVSFALLAGGAFYDDISITIPTPGVAGLFSVAGLAAFRRRR
jgi:hypothetical protein